MSRFLVLFRWANAGVILLTLLAYWSPNVSPKDLWPGTLPGLGYPWLLLLNVLFIVFWIVLRKWNWLLSAGCILVGWSHFQNLVGLNIPASAAGQDYFKVLTLNTHGFTDKKNGSTLPAFFNLLRREKPDIICLQEFYGISQYSKHILDTMARIYESESYHYAAIGSLFIGSRFPIVQKGLIDFPKTTNDCIFADLNLGGKKIRVYSAHLQSNLITAHADRLIESPEYLRDKEAWRDVRTVFGRMRFAAKMRVSQAEELKKHVSSSPIPVILCGDFNDPPVSHVYKILSTSMKDSFREKGFGLGFTFGGSIPALRIDYVLTSPKFEILRHRTMHRNISDHFPVIATIRK